MGHEVGQHREDGRLGAFVDVDERLGRLVDSPRAQADVGCCRGLGALILPARSSWRVNDRWRGLQQVIEEVREVGFGDLVVWSFLMASAHGAGFMVVPFVISTPPTLSAAGHEHVHHIAAAATNGAAVAAMAVAVHTLAYLATMTLAAWLVYRKLGLRLLRKAWLNVDWMWAGALVLTGLVVLMK